jgi:uncharacterized membrane protein (DUF485 family)
VRKRSDRAVAAQGSSGELVARGRGTRWPWLIVAIAAGALKADAYASLVHHRGQLIAALGAALLASLIRQRPKLLLIAGFGAALIASAVAPHPVLAGVALGVGAFVLLVALFFAISTVLHARQRRVQRA